MRMFKSGGRLYRTVKSFYRKQAEIKVRNRPPIPQQLFHHVDTSSSYISVRNNTNKVGNKSDTSIDPVKLAFASYESTNPADASEESPVIIMHGLLGSKANWNSLSKAVHNKTKRKVIAVDARNHGDSPHSPHLSYPHLAADVKLLMDDLRIPKATLIGHSMGGRAMMLLALTEPELVEQLIVVDMSPTSTITTSILVPYLEALQKVHIASGQIMAEARREASNQLEAMGIADPFMRQFFLTNLVEDDGHFKWRVNLDAIIKNFSSNISSFPKIDSTYDGDTLFIGGANSDYIRREDHRAIRELFPRAEFCYIAGAGHWVHSDKPNEFLKVVTKFLMKGRHL